MYVYSNSYISVLHKTIDQKPVLFHFQAKHSNMHAYALSWLPNNDESNQQDNQLLSSFLL